MKRMGLVMCTVLLTSSFAFGFDELSDGIFVTVPSDTVSNSSATTEFTIPISVFATTVDIEIERWELGLDISGRDGATGLTFDSAVLSSSDYVLSSSVGLSTTISDPRLDAGDEHDTSYDTYSSPGSYSKRLITVTLDIAPGTIGVFDVTVDESSSAVYDENSNDMNSITSFNDGVISVVPEPGTMGVLLFGGAVALLRRRRKQT